MTETALKHSETNGHFANLDRAIEELRRGTPATPAAPAYGSPTTKAVSSVVEGLVSNLSEKIKGLHLELESIERQSIASAAAAMHVLTDHVATCERLNEEIDRVQAVVVDLKEKVRD
jgi:hypothetical protein